MATLTRPIEVTITDRYLNAGDTLQLTFEHDGSTVSFEAHENGPIRYPLFCVQRLESVSISTNGITERRQEHWRGTDMFRPKQPADVIEALHRFFRLHESTRKNCRLVMITFESLSEEDDTYRTGCTHTHRLHILAGPVAS